MDSFSMDSPATITPSQMDADDYPQTPTDFATPTPSASSPSSANHGKRKRKSWGQPIPEYDPILPPGKRAKTEEEKEQRRCERIVRNRKAAATSRDRKKHEFERLEQENQELRDTLARFEAELKRLRGQTPPDTDPALSQNLPTPAFTAVDSKVGSSIVRPSSPAISVASLSNHKHTSPTLTPSLFIKTEASDMNSMYSHETPQAFQHLPDFSSLDDLINTTTDNPQSTLDSFTNLEKSGLTQYPAAVLCDLQCQPEALKVESEANNNKWINSVLIIQLMVLNVMSNIYSKTMLSTMSQILTSLELILPRLLSCPSTLDMIFPLIHTLITTPPTTESPSSRRAFRMAFLRRLLSCSPVSARLFDDATARALQRLSSAEAIQESGKDGLSWASLLTMRWAIKSVEKEQNMFQKRLKISSSTSATTTAGQSASIATKLPLSPMESSNFGSLGQTGGKSFQGVSQHPHPHQGGSCTPTSHVH